MEMLEVAFVTCKGRRWHVYKFDLREKQRVFLQFFVSNASKGSSFTARGCLKECDLAKDRSFDMSSVEGAEPLDPKAGLEKLLRELGDVTCDYSINPPP